MTDEAEYENQSFMKNNYFYCERVVNNQFVGRYVKEKKRTVGLARHTYFYYDITFKDGSESYVRMRRKYRDAMERYF